MTVRNIEFLFNPSSVALVGASRKPGSIGAVIAHNLVVGGFGGDIFFVKRWPHRPVPADRRLAIRPYPKELEETLVLPGGQELFLRPIRPEDEPALQGLFARLSKEEIRLRFLHAMKILSHDMAARLTRIDYDREMALVLTDPGVPAEPMLYGVVRLAADPDNRRAEFAILIRRDFTGMGLGPMLMRRIIDYARQRGIGELFGDVLVDNRPMLKLCEAFGFKKKYDPREPDVAIVTLPL